MTKEEAKKRIEKLKVLIDRHRYLYHVLDRQEMSDSVWDSLKRELLLLESQYPDLVTPDSPTQRVGGEPLSRFLKVAHKVPMLSIEDVFEVKEALDWEAYLVRLLERVERGQTPQAEAGSDPATLEYFAELKIDGFAVSLVYENGVFVRGSTRGNGIVGEDVTQNLKTIESIPLKLEKSQITTNKLQTISNEKKHKSKTDLEFGIWNLESPPAELEVRGEVYMAKKDFEKLNRQRRKNKESEFANPRNVAAGSIRQLDPKLASQRPLRFMAYDVMTSLSKTHAEEHALLEALGFRTDKTARICKSIQEAIMYWKEMEKKRASLPFLIDGIVVSVNDNSIFQKLGVVGKSPRGIRALKFTGSQATTKILDIKLQVGRTGAITPVAVLAPLRVAGVMISRASLHNEDEIIRLGVKIGDTVVVERAGDVIPSVVKTLEDLRNGSEKNFHMPSNCPACGAKLIRSKDEVVTRCVNKECPAQKKEFLYHFVSKKAFDIQGLGPKILDRLVEENLVSLPSDIFELQEGDLAVLERFGEKSSRNIISSIQKSKEISLHRFLYSLGIRHVGEETCLELAKHFRSLQDVQLASVEYLKSIQDIGEVVAHSIYSWFRSKENQAMMHGLLSIGVRIQFFRHSLGEGGQTKLKGLSFVLTGSLRALTRDEAKQRVRVLGGEVSESISKQTHYVVAGENPGSKLQKAKSLDLKILTEQQFLNLLSN